MAIEQFLARVDNTRFFVEFDGQYVSTTDTPSHAAHLSYAQADSACQRLRKRGFPQAVVTDIAGNVMTYGAIKLAIDAAQKVEASLPKTIEELDRIPISEYKRRFKTEEVFRERANELEAQPRVAPKAAR
jgi:hypothetical protein